MAYQVPYDNHHGGYVPAPQSHPEAVNSLPKNLLQDGLGKAKEFLSNPASFDELRQQLEGPKPLRVIAGLGGFALAIASALGLVNIFKLLVHPAQFLLEVYEMLFGIIITVVEIKAFFKPGNTFRDFCYKWFPFLTIIGGKGAFYIFTGTLGLGFGMSNMILFVPACFVLGMGVIYVLFHFGQCASLREKYDQVATPNGATQWMGGGTPNFATTYPATNYTGGAISEASFGA